LHSVTFEIQRQRQRENYNFRMKYRISLFLIIACLQISWSQKSEKRSFAYNSANFVEVLTDIEKKFDVRYSYVDSIASGKKITLPKALYSLEEIHSEIVKQTQLRIIKIDERFYSVVVSSDESEMKSYMLDDVLVEGFLAKGSIKPARKW